MGSCGSGQRQAAHADTILHQVCTPSFLLFTLFAGFFSFHIFFSFLVVLSAKFYVLSFCFILQNIFTYAYIYVCNCVCMYMCVRFTVTPSDCLSFLFIYLPVDTVHQDAVMLCATGSSEPERYACTPIHIICHSSCPRPPSFCPYSCTCTSTCCRPCRCHSSCPCPCPCMTFIFNPLTPN